MYCYGAIITINLSTFMTPLKGDPKIYDFIITPAEGVNMSITPSMYLKIKQNSDAFSMAVEMVKCLEGYSDKQYDDGINGAKSIGYGFNVEDEGAKKIYDLALEKYPDEPTFAEVKNGAKISEPFAQELLYQKVLDKKNYLDNTLTKKTFGINIDVNDLPKEVYAGLIAAYYHNSSVVGVIDSKKRLLVDEGFKEAVQAIAADNNDVVARKNLTDLYTKSLSKRPGDAYKFTNLATSLSLFFTGDSKYVIPTWIADDFVRSAAKDGQIGVVSLNTSDKDYMSKLNGLLETSLKIEVITREEADIRRREPKKGKTDKRSGSVDHESTNPFEIDPQEFLRTTNDMEGIAVQQVSYPVLSDAKFKERSLIPEGIG